MQHWEQRLSVICGTLGLSSDMCWARGSSVFGWGGGVFAVCAQNGAAACLQCVPGWLQTYRRAAALCSERADSTGKRPGINGDKAGETLKGSVQLPSARERWRLSCSPASLSFSALWQECPSSPLLVCMVAGGGKEHRQEKAAGSQCAGAGSCSALCTGFILPLTTAGPSVHPDHSPPLHPSSLDLLFLAVLPLSSLYPFPVQGDWGQMYSILSQTLQLTVPGSDRWAFTALPGTSLCYKRQISSPRRFTWTPDIRGSQSWWQQATHKWPIEPCSSWLSSEIPRSPSLALLDSRLPVQSVAVQSARAQWGPIHGCACQENQLRGSQPWRVVFVMLVIAMSCLLQRSGCVWPLCSPL